MVYNIGKFNTNKIRCDYVSTLVVVFKFKCMFYIVFERVYLFKKKKKTLETSYERNLLEIRNICKIYSRIYMFRILF